MRHYMNLFSEPFQMIKSGKKDIELRLYDEKRRKICVNDIIVFTNIDTKEFIETECLKIHIAESFVKLFEMINNNERVGSQVTETHEEMAEQMRVYYSKEDEEKYGVVGIEVVLI